MSIQSSALLLFGIELQLLPLKLNWIDPNGVIDDAQTHCTT